VCQDDWCQAKIQTECRPKTRQNLYLLWHLCMVHGPLEHVTVTQPVKNSVPGSRKPKCLIPIYLFVVYLAMESVAETL
jgi:hypothetical protein